MQLNTLFTVGKCFTKEKQQQQRQQKTSEITSMTLYHDAEKKRIVKPMKTK